MVEILLLCHHKNNVAVRWLHFIKMKIGGESSMFIFLYKCNLKILKDGMVELSFGVSALVIQ